MFKDENPHRSIAGYKKPPLCRLDWAVYGCLVFVLGGLVPLVLFASADMRLNPDDVPGVIARQWLAAAYSHYCAPAIAFACFDYWWYVTASCQPLFGDPAIDYARAYDGSLYPLFPRGRQKHPPGKAALRRRKRFLRQAALAGTVYLLLAASAVLCLGPRAEIRDDLTMVEYGVLGQPVKTYGMEDQTRVVLDSNLCGTIGYPRSNPYWAPCFYIHTADGKEMRFDYYDFTQKSFVNMLAYKNALPRGKLRVVPQNVMDDMEAYFTHGGGKGPTEIAAMYALFDMQAP